MSVQMHGYIKRVAIENLDATFNDVACHMQQVFTAGMPIIAVCATGIIIRSLAPVLYNKHHEPAVIAIAEDGCAVVPLLGGHQGGNALAETCAQALGIQAAITTAGDAVFHALFTAKEQGYCLDPQASAKDVIANGLAKRRVRLINTTTAKTDPFLASIQPDANETMHIETVRTLANKRSDIAEIVVSEYPVKEHSNRLVYYPQRYTLGVGCVRGASCQSVFDLIEKTCQQAGIALAAIASINSIDLKANEPALLNLANRLKRPFRFFSRDALNAEVTRLATPSAEVLSHVGCLGVCEAAALAAAGAQAELVVPKQKNNQATCALARAEAPITHHRGNRRGLVVLAGIGPGTNDWCTPEVSRWLTKADRVVGYRGYLDLLGTRVVHKLCVGFALGEEEKRCRYAVETASKGEIVVLVCSGDAGIYGMASLVFQLIERAQDSAHPLYTCARRADVIVCPGISAMQAAAARSGALLGNDFCAISLSDLLTPRSVILQRVKAAAKGDFSIAFYNPASQERQTLLNECRDILLEHRPFDTPVVLAKNVGRAPESIRHIPLNDLNSAEVDMLTLVLVGACDARHYTHTGCSYAYTPRGYGGG